MLHIGTTEIVALPDAGVIDVPAKVDTGADSSAIWATNIVETKQELQFVLFAPGAQWYTGAVHTTKDYQVIAVKNSFGQSEFRYKVPLKLQIGGKTINAKFTLANRAGNRFPILVGRRTLHGKFLVDVTRKLAKGTGQVLMLSTKRTDVTARLAANADASSQKLKVHYAAYEDLVYQTGPNVNSVTLRETGQDLAEFDLIHFKTTSRYADIAAATARYAQLRGVPFIDEAIQYFASTSKLYQYILLADQELNVPPSIFVFPHVLHRSYDMLVSKLGTPFILKDLHGNKGEHNYLVTDKTTFKQACEAASAADVQCVAQAFVPNTGDYRVLVFGSKIGLVIHRSAVQGSHLNNTSRGAQATLVPASELPAHIQKACIAAAKRLGRQIAGVDIVEDKTTGLWYCLEVNDGPQLASGSFTTEKYQALAAYFERKLAL